MAARFNEFITGKLLEGALDGLKRHQVREEDVDVAWVPGAFEIPMIAARMADSGRYDGIICLGAVIRGDTSHYDLVCSEVTKGIASVSLASRSMLPSTTSRYSGLPVALNREATPSSVM